MVVFQIMEQSVEILGNFSKVTHTENFCGAGLCVLNPESCFLWILVILAIEISFKKGNKKVNTLYSTSFV